MGTTLAKAVSFSLCRKTLYQGNPQGSPPPHLPVPGPEQLPGGPVQLFGGGGVTRRWNAGDIVFNKAERLARVKVMDFPQSPADALLHIIVVVCQQGFHETDQQVERLHGPAFGGVLKQTDDTLAPLPGVGVAVPFPIPGQDPVRVFRWCAGDRSGQRVEMPR